MKQYREERLAEILHEFLPLIEKHWEEIAVNQDKIKLNPDFDKYVQMNDCGVLKVYTARDDFGKLIGYFLVMLAPHLHYQDHVFAMNDILYVDPAYRGSTVAYRLIKFVEKQLKEEGVSVLMINMKVHAPFDRFLEGLGFSNTERVYTKFIGD